MPKINLLPKNVAELIAAGEVVERPASVIKELIENSIDAGANVITVEIQRGGITYIRVTDNGCGIAYQDVPTAFLRHATSKIKVGADLDNIATLGFRGEALAAVSSVARVEMLTTAKGENIGTHYLIEGGQEIEYSEAGAPQGTTIIIRDIFYNTPARMKFLKKDTSEANACAAVVDRIALSHPEISFRFIRDGKQTLSTNGNGDTMGTVYSVLGREFSGTLIEVSGENGGISVKGLTCKPVNCRPTRNNQFTYLNGRLVRSGTVIAAVEQAYKNSAMVGKFPGFILYITLPFDTVDVNVHPAKTEVRFSDEKRVFDAVYIAIKNSLANGDTRPEVKLNKPVFNRFEHMTTEQYRQQSLDENKTIAEKAYDKKPFIRDKKDDNALVLNSSSIYDVKKIYSSNANEDKKFEHYMKEQAKNDAKIPAEDIKTPVETFSEAKDNQSSVDYKSVENITEKEEKLPIKAIGEAFSTYIIAQMGDSIYMIDKHAAHERILFNELKKNHTVEVQALLTPVSIILPKAEYDAIIENTEILLQSGFEVDDFGNSTVVVRTVPSLLLKEDVPSLISEMADKLSKNCAIDTEREDDIFHTVACKAAIKAGAITNILEMQALAEKVLWSKDIMYCPHGRPVAFEIKKRELEKQFGRIQ